MKADERYMRRAIELAERGWGQVAPNPLVGAVLVSGDTIVGEGFHARFGEEHAEVAALRQAGRQAAGATLYVNLEPCAHTGKTLACASSIGEAGVAQVVMACRERNPVATGGAERLTAAGVQVRVGVREDEALSLNAPFFWRVTREVPYVALKLATSIDGRIAARPGVRTSLTGEAAREEVHRLRSGFDAILVGSRTVTADDPQLTVRGNVTPRVPPVRVVLDSHLRLATSSRLVASIPEAPVWVVGVEGMSERRRERLEEGGVRVLQIRSSGEGVDLRAALSALKQAGVGTVLVEGGARVASALLRTGHVHRIYLLIAPLFLGDEGLPAFAGLPSSAADEWAVCSRRALGPDTLITFDNRSALDRLRGSA